MKLFVKEKMISIHRKFYIRDENGEAVYLIISKAISIGDKTYIMDKNGHEAAYIEQKIMHFMPHYEVYLNNTLFFNIEKKFVMFKHEYLLDNGYKVFGNFFRTNFSIIDGFGNTVCIINRKFFSLTDEYEIDILKDDILDILLPTFVAIANDINRTQNSSND